MGTKLKLAGSQLADTWSIKKISIDSINDEGTAAFGKDDWRYLDFSGTGLGTLTINEMQIITLPNGASINISGLTVDAASKTLSNDYIDVNSDALVEYKSVGDTDWTVLSKNCLGWHICSKLNIESSENTPQYLNQYQQIILYYLIDGVVQSPITISGSVVDGAYIGKYVAFNTPLSLVGGSNVDLSVLSTAGISYDVSCYVYEFNQAVSTINNVVTALTRTNGYLTIDGLNITSSLSKYITLPFDFKTLTEPAAYIIPIYISGNIPSTASIKLTGKSNAGTQLLFNKYNSGVTAVSEYTLVTGMNLIQVTIGSTTTITPTIVGLNITMSATASKVLDITIVNIGAIKKVAGINSKLTQSALLTGTELLTTIRTLMGSSDDFYYTCTIDNSSDIEVDDLTSPEALWDVNNIANKFTIAELDIDASKIEIAKTSQAA